MPEYTVAAVAAVAGVVLLETRRLRTGLFRSPSYWSTIAISVFFMVLVNGWLTKLSAPIVRYDPDARTPWRFPWDIPVEDFLYGYALLTWVLLRWKADDDEDEPSDSRTRVRGAVRAGGGRSRYDERR
jgi:lycopene cyclase domain-containing protein